MISGVAQVIAMKPIFRSVFSSGFLSCAIACNDATGSTFASAARAVLAPTARKKARRTSSTGNSAFISVASTKSCDSSSGLVARFCSAADSSASCAA